MGWYMEHGPHPVPHPPSSMHATSPRATRRAASTRHCIARRYSTPRRCPAVAWQVLAAVFFCGLFLFTNGILFNLFVAVLLGNFGAGEEECMPMQVISAAGTAA